jgi:hypothetical protein
VQPGDYPLTLYRGDTYHWQFTLWTDDAKTVPADLTGATAKAEIRDTPGGSTIVATVCVITLPNIVDMQLLAAASATLPPKGVWDLQITYTSSGSVMTVLAGQVLVTADVTDSTSGLVAVAAPPVVPHVRAVG